MSILHGSTVVPVNLRMTMNEYDRVTAFQVHNLVLDSTGINIYVNILSQNMLLKRYTVLGLGKLLLG